MTLGRKQNLQLSASNPVVVLKAQTPNGSRSAGLLTMSESQTTHPGCSVLKGHTCINFENERYTQLTSTVLLYLKSSYLEFLSCFIESR